MSCHPGDNMMLITARSRRSCAARHWLQRLLLRPVHEGYAKETLGYINQQIVIGAIAVRPGDIVSADNDGVVIVPKERSPTSASSRGLARRKPA
ncbi:hypothetical protein [Bradyrhizobium genosp. SA-3]|uniref:RraA family protein n=1 Tax=Bradyrhizobium genosp. SA-3 TaxID=508868 RepID=UPI001FE1F9E2|nr:hypothetical protein [Bradyrhizobium genosp. SA-3]